MNKARRDKVKNLKFICPKCLGVLANEVNTLYCEKCLRRYEVTKAGKVVFDSLGQDSIGDSLDRLKNVLKRFSRTYNFFIAVISPVYPTRDLQKFLKSKNFDSEVVINLGSGSSNVHPRVVNFDLFEYESVDVLSSIDSLPLADNSIDAILNIAVLEHVKNPEKVVSEFFRVLRPGGEAFCFVPFIQGFHASPWDFQRFTSSGLRELFKDFEIVKLKPIGPTSGLLWVFQEWFAIAFSFGSKKIHFFLWLLAVVTTWPIKFLDFFFQKNKMSENIASGFVVVASKKRI
jgi:SAM-dependent methyltransferase